MKIALTFDDGPSQWTPPILDILAEHEAHATFFVCGVNLLGHSELVQGMFDAGHQIGNHTTTHPDLSRLDSLAVARELAETELMIAAIVGEPPTVWRAPYLRQPNRPLEADVRHAGCDVIPGDWAEPSPQRIAESVMDDAADGAIVLLHDGRPPGQPAHADGGSLDSREGTVEATRLLVPALIEAGYELVTVSNL